MVFNDMIANMISNEKLHGVVTEVFIRSNKSYFTLVFNIQLYFQVPKYVRQNTTQFFIMEIPNKQGFPQISTNHSSNFDDFKRLNRKFFW